jgi:hypothetical protein
VLTDLLITLGPVAAVGAVLLMSSDRCRTLLRSVFRKPSQSTTVLKVDDEWVTVDYRSDTPRETREHLIKNAIATAGQGSAKAYHGPGGAP